LSGLYPLFYKEVHMALIKPASTTKQNDNRADIFADRLKQIAAQTSETIPDDTTTTFPVARDEKINDPINPIVTEEASPKKKKKSTHTQAASLRAKKFVSISTENEHLLKTYAFMTKMQNEEKTESQIVNDALDYYFTFLKKTGKLVSIDFSSFTSGK